MLPIVHREIVLHPDYIRNEKDQNDIALVKLRRKAILNELVNPICLPPSSSFKDTDLPEVYVAGWGLLSDKKCTTKDEGPSPHAR